MCTILTIQIFLAVELWFEHQAVGLSIHGAEAEVRVIDETEKMRLESTELVVVFDSTDLG